MRTRHARAIRIGINSKRLMYRNTYASAFGTFASVLDIGDMWDVQLALETLHGKERELADKAARRTKPFTVKRDEPGYQEAVCAYRKRNQEVKVLHE